MKLPIDVLRYKPETNNPNEKESNTNSLWGASPISKSLPVLETSMELLHDFIKSALPFSKT